jgi:preprotein translocase subunit SecY
VSGLPSAFSAIYAAGAWKLAVFLAFFVAMLWVIVYIELGQRRIPVQFAKRVVGRRMYSGQSTYIPLKVNQAGIIPIIFASAVINLPVLLSQVLPADGWGQSVSRWINDNLANTINPIYLAVLGLFIVGFSYFYTAIAFDPVRRPRATWPRCSTGSPCRARCSSRCSRSCRRSSSGSCSARPAAALRTPSAVPRS